MSILKSFFWDLKHALLKLLVVEIWFRNLYRFLLKAWTSTLKYAWTACQAIPIMGQPMSWTFYSALFQMDAGGPGFFWRLPCWYFLQPETTTWTSYFNSMIPNHYYKKLVFHHFHPFTPRKLNSSPLKKWCLEDDPFLLGPGNFSGKTRC